MRDFDVRTRKRLMQGQYSQEGPKMEEGLFTWYGPGGNVESEANYVHGKKTELFFYNKASLYERDSVLNDTMVHIYEYNYNKNVIASYLRINAHDYVIGKDTLLFNHRFANTFNKRREGECGFAIKWKLFPWVFFGSGVTYTLGTEYIFKNHSLELLASYSDLSSAKEDNDGNPLPRVYTVMRYVQISYRQYIKPWKSFNNIDKKFYLSGFIRYARWEDFYQKGAETNYIKNINTDVGIGLLFGLLLNTNENRYLDIFIGPQYRFRQVSSTQLLNSLPVDQNYSDNGFNLRLGFNFGFAVGKKRSL